jgi:hypothetical protein
MREGTSLKRTLLRLESSEVEVHLVSNPDRDYLVGQIIEVGDDYLHLDDPEDDAAPMLIPFASIAYLTF